MSEERALTAGGTLLAGSPRAVLARLVPGDPLSLRQEVARRLHERALLVDGDLLHLRALARCAHGAPRLGPGDELEAWRRARIDEAIDELLAEPAVPTAPVDRPAPGRRSAPSAPAPGAGELVTSSGALAAGLGWRPEVARGACAAFNRLPLADRRAFFRVVVDGGGLEEVAAATTRAATELARGARRGLLALLGGAARASLPPPASSPSPSPSPAGGHTPRRRKT